MLIALSGGKQWKNESNEPSALGRRPIIETLPIHATRRTGDRA
jgi:hypothetical protein